MYATYPVYYPSRRYAKENDEIMLWKESFKINKECRDLINTKASPFFHDERLSEFAADLANTYGLERAMYVMARFIVTADWDKRYDSKTRERVALFSFADRNEVKENRGAMHDATEDLHSNVHPCILNGLFHILMKMEQEQINLPCADVSTENEHDEGTEI